MWKCFAFPHHLSLYPSLSECRSCFCFLFRVYFVCVRVLCVCVCLPTRVYVCVWVCVGRGGVVEDGMWTEHFFFVSLLPRFFSVPIALMIISSDLVSARLFFFHLHHLFTLPAALPWYNLSAGLKYHCSKNSHTSYLLLPNFRYLYHSYLEACKKKRNTSHGIHNGTVLALSWCYFK